MSKVKAYAAAGRIGRVLAARLLPGQDLVEGIIELIKLNDITSGTITAIGSLRSAKVVWAGSMKFGDNPMDVAVFHEMVGPVELGVSNGVFGTDEDGEIVLHVHGLIMDKEGNMRCGNLLPGSAPVLATVELTIQEFDGLELKPTLDPEWKHNFLHPVKSAD
jgi:predicted DNA-binding protein with PD1-like motif